MESSPLLYAQPPERSEAPIPALQTLAEGLQMTLAECGVVRVFVGVSQRYGHKPSVGSPESCAVDGSEASEEVPPANPGEASYLASDAPTAMRTGRARVPGCGVLEGECGYGAAYGR